MNPENKKFWDKSTKLLVISNIITIVFAVIEGWDLNTLLWIYWFQSIIIGYFNYVRMLKIENPNKQNLTINELVAKKIKKGKKTNASFFLIHYGWFQGVYMIFLIKICFNQIKESIINFDYLILLSLLSIIFSIVIFYFNHKKSFVLNYEEDLKGNPKTGTLMLIPYARIIPMHIITIFAASTVPEDNSLATWYWTLVVLFFLVMKTIADVVMHKAEHNYLRKNITVINPEIIIKN